MKISRYTHRLVGLCIASALVIFVVLSNKYLHLQQANESLQRLQVNHNNSEITQTILSQWNATIQLFYQDRQSYLAGGVSNQTMQLLSRLENMEKNLGNNPELSQLKTRIAIESQIIVKSAFEDVGEKHNWSAQRQNSNANIDEVEHLFDTLTKMLNQQYQDKHEEVEQMRLQFQIQAVLGLLAYIVLVTGASYWTNRILIRPLERLTHLTDNDPSGLEIDNLRLNEGPEEVQRLSNSFNNLYQRVNQQIDEALKSRASEQRARDRLKALVDKVSLSIITMDTNGTINHFNPATAELFKRSDDRLYGEQITELLPDLKIQGGLFQQMLNTGVDIELDAVVGNSIKTVELSCAELSFNDDPKAVQYILILHDISQRKRSEDRMAKMNQRLINTSRQAGIAEIATSILHSVGNVLNSVNTSVSMLQQGLEKGQIEGFKRSNQMLREQSAELFAPDGKGPQLLDYLDALIQQAESERNKNLQEIASLKQNINHIAEIISAQQKFSGKSGVIEKLNLTQLIEEALNINVVSMENNKVEIVRNYPSHIEINGDRSKIVQILVNLIRNANEAMMPPRPAPPKIIISVEVKYYDIVLNVQDNGQGISKENMKNMFRYGFTTKPNGHGFGLHSCALAAKEMYGSLTVHSEGQDRGARFELILPIDPADVHRLQIPTHSSEQTETDNG